LSYRGASAYNADPSLCECIGKRYSRLHKELIKIDDSLSYSLLAAHEATAVRIRFQSFNRSGNCCENGESGNAGQNLLKNTVGLGQCGRSGSAQRNPMMKILSLNTNTHVGQLQNLQVALDVFAKVVDVHDGGDANNDDEQQQQRVAGL